jgi:hypothetical protein
MRTVGVAEIGAPPNCGGPGMPQRNMASSRMPPGALRTTGAMVSGKIPGSSGRLPVVSRMARAMAMIAA